MVSDCKKTTSQIVREYILSGIKQRKFLPGTPVREEIVCEACSCSATPVREAFRQLEKEGWLTNFPYRGCFVRIVSAAAEKRFGAVQRTPERQSGRQPMRKSAKQLRPKSCAFEKILFAEKTAWFETRQTAVPAGAAAPGCAPRSGAQGGCRRRHSRRSGLPAADNDLP